MVGNVFEWMVFLFFKCGDVPFHVCVSVFLLLDFVFGCVECRRSIRPLLDIWHRRGSFHAERKIKFYYFLVNLCSKNVFLRLFVDA
mgnify:CR=1 FL=1